ncbi:hypothetical protein Q5762_33870 [Streptomyces sp. P9(2023)]|uniref:hypothetical protein n=1 Tax=Streptomyces sp. P9(2023) TaxID=3064394 RepID=UPI0028F40D6D|nr:hypothetical protein [Streptomyces sp. P9(2023)]MDT9693227.1 hypothetical protein [Streptomyces sp. P9(2023)]
MAVIVIVEFPGATQEMYEQSSAQVTAAPWWPAEGFIAHAAGPDGSGGWRVVDFWESQESFVAFTEKAMPILQSSGMPTPIPTFQDAVNVILR